MGKGWPSRPSGVVGPNFAVTKICVAICLAELGTRMVMMIKWTEGERFVPMTSEAYLKYC